EPDRPELVTNRLAGHARRAHGAECHRRNQLYGARPVDEALGRIPLADRSGPGVGPCPVYAIEQPGHLLDIAQPLIWLLKSEEVNRAGVAVPYLVADRMENGVKPRPHSVADVVGCDAEVGRGHLTRL